MMTKPMIRRSLFLCPFIFARWAAPLYDSGDSVFSSPEEDLTPKDQSRDYYYHGSELTGKAFHISGAREWVRRSLGRSNGWSSLAFNNQPSRNSDSGPFLEVAPLVSAPTNYRRKNISQDLARNDETFLRMSCHFHPCCRKLNSHGFGPIKKLLDFGQC